MALRDNTAMANRLADSAATAFNGGTLEIYTGTQPASGDTAVAGTLLATITLPATAFGAAVNGVASKAGTWQATVTTGGTAGWARLLGTGGTLRRDMAVGAELTLDNAVLVQNGVVTVNTCTITQPLS